jgi:magnesium chelatase subunit D
VSGVLAWSDAVIAAQLFGVDPAGTGGILLRSRSGPVRERWLAIVRASLPSSMPLRNVPLHIADGRLLGGLDLSATLLAGHPVAERGLLSEADGGVILLAMAERLASHTTAHVTAAMDNGESIVERDGLSLRMRSRFGVVALDEGLDDEFAPAALHDRLAFHIDLNDIPIRDAEQLDVDVANITAARNRLPAIDLESGEIQAICSAALELGIVSLRAPLQTLAVARASAALSGNTKVTQDDVALAARLVLAPRALILPPSQQTEQQAEPPPEPDQQDTSEEDREEQIPDIDRALDEVVLAAAQAAIPPGVLAMLRDASSNRSGGKSGGKAGELQKSKQRGRPAGSQRGELRAGAKLNVIETLRAAAPWQPLRRTELRRSGDDTSRPRILVRRDDFRVARFKQRTETTTIFVVDASGSAALHRLAEAKGAVELLLADCYVRRDQVALISFRGQVAELLLPPTRSLARAKRSLAGLPGGGGTPLAAALDAAFMLADSIRRKGQTPTVILLTDGRANIARDGAPGRPQAEADAKTAAKAFSATRIKAVLVDTSPRPGPLAEEFAATMGARYLPLPYADATAISTAVKAATA